jgi:type 1 glutamine amidotransferase
MRASVVAWLSVAGCGLFATHGCNAILGNEGGYLVAGASGTDTSEGGDAGAFGGTGDTSGGAGRSVGGAATSGAGGRGGSGGSGGSGNQGGTGGSGGAAGKGANTGGSGGGDSGGSAGTGGSAAGSGGSSGSGGDGGSAVGGGSGTGGGSAGDGTGGLSNGGAGGTGGDGGSAAGLGGSAGTAGSSGAGGSPPTGPYAPRNGAFSLLLYRKTAAYTHDAGSYTAAQTVISEIGTEYDFSVVYTTTNEHFTAAGLAQFEIVMFLNTSGDVLASAEEAAFQTWMTTNEGAWGGIHHAVDTEAAWPFYLELMGQRAGLHTNQGTPDEVNFAAEYESHPAVRDLPNPWALEDEWWHFSDTSWPSNPGFQIWGRKASNNQPIIWGRQHDNYRSFYVGLGHTAAIFQNANVKTLLTGSILWAVRREHLLPP